MVSAVYHYQCQCCGKTTGLGAAKRGACPYGVQGPGGRGGERTWDSVARDSLYDTPGHTGDYLNYPGYVRSINGGWC